MKTVFSSHAECIHTFFQFEQSHGRACNVFFDGPALYSYGRHFELARKLSDGTLLINTQSYSLSTAKHQSIVSSAVNRYKVTQVFYIDFVNGTFNPFRAIEYNLKRANDLFISWNDGGRKSFKPLEKIAFHLLELEKYEKLGSYSIDYSRLNFIISDVLTELETRKAFQARVNEKRAQSIETAKQRTEKENLILWIKGLYNGSFHGMKKIYLRRKGENIETTRGAKVPFIDAVNMVKDIRAGVDVTGRKIGAYQVNKVTIDNIVIGCHVIDFETVNELFQ